MTEGLSPWSAYAIERVEQGPVALDRLVAESMAKVPPGKAYRTALRQVENQRNREGSDERVFTDAESKRDRRIRYGQRYTALSSIRKLISRARFETYEEGEVTMVRLGPRTAESAYDRPTLMTETGKALLRAAVDGPVRLQPLMDSFTYLIPREQAIDKVRRDRVRARSKYQPKSGRRVTPAPDNDLADYHFGARRYTGKVLHELIQRKRIIVTGEGEDRMVTKGPRWFDPDAPTP